MSIWTENFIVDAFSICFSNKRMGRVVERDFSLLQIFGLFFIYGLSRQLLEILFGGESYGYFFRIVSFTNTILFSYVLLFTTTVILYWESKALKENPDFKAMVNIATYLLITFPLVAALSYFFNYGGPFHLLPEIPIYFYVPAFDNPLMYPNIYMPMGLTIVIIILFIRVPGLISSNFNINLKKTLLMVIIFFLFLFWYAFMISYRIGVAWNGGILDGNFTYYYNLFFYGIIFILLPIFIRYYGGLKTRSDKISTVVFVGTLTSFLVWNIVNLPYFTLS